MVHNNNGYKKGCRCDECRRDHSKQLNIWRLRGKQTRDPEKAELHVKKLLKGGMSKRQVAAAAGVSTSTIDRLTSPTRSALPILAVSERKILKVEMSAIKARKLVDVSVSRRKLRALVAIGWSQRQLAIKLEMEKNHLNSIISECKKSGPSILYATKRKIDELYEQLCMTPGPSDRARKHAQLKKWLPPLAWEDIEDLSERPVYHKVVHSSAIEYARAVAKKTA